MNAELKTKWLEALRSGKYKQGRGRLRQGDEFCCLGVLCDISGLGEWIGEVETKGYSFKEDIRYGTLPRHMVPELSCKTSNSLTGMNDSGKSFAEIADYIEENL